MSISQQLWFASEQPIQVIGRTHDVPRKWFYTVRCVHPEHDPPHYMCYPDGEHVHTCPRCGSHTMVFVDRGRL